MSKNLHSDSTRQRTNDGLKDVEGPVAKHLRGMFPRGLKTGLKREGIGFRKEEVEHYHVAFSWAENTESAFMNIIEELKGHYEAAKHLWSNYNDQLKSFRSQVKNDVSSLEASARKTTRAVQKMQKAYGDVIEVMNGEEMARAVENAERLANAMSALAGLESHKLVLDVSDGNTGSD